MTLFPPAIPRIYTVAPHRPFLDDLAAALLRELSDPRDPFALADAIVLVPNRRAARELASAFVRAAGDDPQATLLPAIRALGDLEENEPPFAPGDLELDVPPALSAARRRFELGTLLHAKARAQDERADPAAALALAEELGRLIDDVAAAGADLGAIRGEMLDRLPAHLQQSVTFLEIVLAHWPDRLAEPGRIDAAAREERLLHELAKRWADAPPAGPVIAAGSTGSQAATRKVLAAVARLPRGAVVLPGVDVDLDDRGWDEIDDGHPQHNLKRTLAELGVGRGDVRLWPGSEEGRGAASRRRLINEALRPAAATDDWLARIARLDAELGGDVAADGLAGLSLVEAPTPDAEARAVALAAREAIEEGGRSVMVVTPDLGLADRVAVALGRFGVEADVSAGRPLIETAPGAFLAHVLALAQDPGDPVALCALVKHELTALGRSHEDARRRFSEVERKGLRGVRAGRDLAALVRRLEAQEAHESAIVLVGVIGTALAPLVDLADEGGDEPRWLADWAAAHTAAAEAVARERDSSGAERLWREDAGEAAAQLMRELIEETESFPAVTLDAYARIFEKLARARSVRRRGADGPRVRILGPLEARLQSADLVIAAGLNEGTWPARPSEDPFMSRGMRAKAGLPSPERRLSLAAHDFAQLACAPRVMLTRALKDDSGPTVASRWLWRLQTLARGASAPADAMRPGLDYVALAKALDRVAPEDARPVGPPAARPPVAARPRKLSASAVQEWVRDPYGLYARRVLGLYPLEPLDKPPGPMERGNAVHEALEKLLLAHPGALPEGFAALLAEAAIAALERHGFTHAELASQAPRVRRVAAWFADWERARRDAGWRPAAIELKGETTLSGPGGPLVLHAKADRIDVGPAGAAILDYKTGYPPSAKEVETGLAPQLGVEGVILMRGGFPGLPAAAPAELFYLRLSGGRTVAEDRSALKDGSAEATAKHVQDTLEGLARKIAFYDDPSTAYLSRARVKSVAEARDFDRLARVKEWASPGEEE